MLKYGLLLGLASIALHLLFYLTGWDQTVKLAGIIIFLGDILLGFAAFFSMGFALRRLAGRVPFMMMLVHCILLAFGAAATKSAYLYVFYEYMEPQYFLKTLENSLPELRSYALESITLEEKETYQKHIADREKQILELRQNPGLLKELHGRMIVQELASRLISALIYGSVLGMLFMGMVAAPPKEAEAKPDENTKRQ